MKRIKNFCAAMLLILVSTVSLNASMVDCLTVCASNGGYNVGIIQNANGWEMSIYNGNESIDDFSGSGQYSGTICEGVTTCHY